MKLRLNLLLSLLFAIVTSFAAIHEVKHIQHNDSAGCLICTVNNNILSADTPSFASQIERFHFEAIAHAAPVTYFHVETKSNQNRAPPVLS